MHKRIVSLIVLIALICTNISYADENGKSIISIDTDEKGENTYLKVLHKDEYYYLYFDKDTLKCSIPGIYIDPDKGDMFKGLQASQYLEAYKKMIEQRPDQIYYGMTTESVKAFIEKKTGQEVTEQLTVTEGFQYLFLAAYFNAYFKIEEGLDTSKFSEIQETNPPKYFFNLLDNSDITTYKELLKEANRYALARTTAEVIEYKSERIEEYLTKEMGYDTLQHAINTAVVLAWPNLDDKETLIEISDKLESTETTRHELALEFYDKVQKEFTPEEQVYIYSIFKGRGSAEIGEPLIKKPNTGIKPSTNAEIAAKNALKDTLVKLDLFENSTNEQKQQVTISSRLKYHWYSMQSVMTDPSSIIVNQLSKIESIHVSDIEPIILNNTKVYDALQYTYFMNALNEFTVLDAVITKWSSNLTSIENLNIHDSDVVNNVRYLTQWKEAITFLETIPEIGFQKVIDKWYEGDDSLENLYRQVKTLGIDEAILNVDIAEDKDRPLSRYFNVEEGKLGSYLKIGIANSATYIPMRTNLYDPHTYQLIENEDFFTKFHYIWGFNRKLLYTDNRAHAAVETYNTGIVDNLKVATLADVLNSSRDIVLYVDSNYYNSDEVKLSEEAIKLMHEASVSTKYAVNKIEDGIDAINNPVDTLLSSVWGLVNAAGNTMIDANLFTFKLAVKLIPQKTDIDKIMLEEDALKLIEDESYSAPKATAIETLLMRDSNFGQLIKSHAKQPIFVSSQGLSKVPGASKVEYASYYNYILLQNIRNTQVINYKSNVDYNKPVYADAYGNIVTESGYVVIPAAANATLTKEFYPFTAAFLTTYGDTYKADLEHDFMPQQYFVKNEINGNYDIKAVTVNDIIDTEYLSTANPETQRQLYNLIRLRLEKDYFRDLDIIAAITIEAMRGAPIEYIEDNRFVETKKAGIVQAYKFKQLREALDMSSINSILSVPNLAFVEGFDYWIFLIYKIALIVALVLVLIQIVTMVMTFNLSLSAIGKVLGTVALTVSVLIAIPTIFSLSYYQINKSLLQSEVEYITMLNLERKEAGVELSMSGLEDNKQASKLLLMVDDLNIPWYTLFFDVASKDMTKVYKEKVTHSPTYGLDGLEFREGKMYISTDSLFDSSTIVFDSEFKTLYQRTKGDLPVAFFSPYYAFINALTGNINSYNLNTASASYTTQVYQSGKIMSLGMIESYFTSEAFMNENGDPLHLKQMYGLFSDTDLETPFSPEDIQLIQNTNWCDITSDETAQLDRIKTLNKSAREFVIKNKDLIGRISDETFIKTMALSLAIEHNKLFMVGSVDAIEVYNLAPEDLIRLSILPRKDVMVGSSYAYPRYIFENTGLLGVYLATMLDIVIFIISWVKPVITVILFVALFASIFIYKLILRRKSDNIKGMLKIFILLICTNLLYALLIKASMYLPVIGVKPTIALLLLIVLHIVFISAFIWIAITVIANWKDLGSNKINITISNLKDLIVSKAENRDKNAGWKLYDKLKEREEARR